MNTQPEKLSRRWRRIAALIAGVLLVAAWCSVVLRTPIDHRLVGKWRFKSPDHFIEPDQEITLDADGTGEWSVSGKVSWTYAEPGAIRWWVINDEICFASNVQLIYFSPGPPTIGGKLELLRIKLEPHVRRAIALLTMAPDPSIDFRCRYRILPNGSLEIDAPPYGDKGPLHLRLISR